MIVQILYYREKVITFFFFLVDTPDPQIEVSCSQSKPPNTFKTRNIKDNVTKGELHVEFKFVIPPERDPNKDLDIEVRFDSVGLIFENTVVSKRNGIKGA